MDLSSIYSISYLILISILLLNQINKARVPEFENPGSAKFGSNNILLIVLLILAVGFRPREVGADTCQYMDLYSYYTIPGFDFEFANDENPIFFYLMFLFGQAQLPVNLFFTLIAAIYFVCISIACRKLFPGNSYFAFLSYLIGFSTFSYSINGIKAGAATAIFLVALAYHEKKWLSILLAFFTIGFHHSMVMVIYSYIIVLFYKNTKYYFYLWLFAFLIAILHIGFFQSLFASMADDRGAEYLNPTGEGAYITGFRLDFILYSAAPVYVGYILFFKRGFRHYKYELLLRLYLMTNSVWMLCMYASFTNRIAYLSWFLLPIVLLYPFYAIRTSDDQLLIGRKISYFHMLFTLFVILIYDTILRLFLI